MFEKLDAIDSAPFDLLLLANPSKELLLKHLESGECFVYKNNFEVLGCYILKEINKNRVELLDIAVRENKQGLGIGKKMLSHLFNHVKKMDIQKLLLELVIQV
ncbi:GNAT family N-acetyltransferase [Staphylococcus hominis]|uniref:GNAT family N-acetyltransferase n=1 Tax=Staphylococcus hominis TaxID=1290 RepID=UPI000E051152|nr:GNAT family N-acetyltransferase [Staphylococcus hominis]SUM67847.1 Uncharacterized N-acetyltransferase YvbK [Staphylococcus hominis]